MARLSLRWRVAIAFGLGSLMITGVLAVLTWNLASGYMLRQRELGATTQAQVNLRLVKGALGDDPANLADLLQGLATDSDTTVLLHRRDGWLTSGRQIEPGLLPRPLIELAQHGTPAHQRLVVDRGTRPGRGAWPVNADRRAAVQLFPLTQLDQARSGSSAPCSSAGVAAPAPLLGVGGTGALGRPAAPCGRSPSSPRAASPRRGRSTCRHDLPLREHPRSRLARPHLQPTRPTRWSAGSAQDARFAGDVSSHELRSPLTTMANAAAVLSRRRDELSGTAARALELLLAEVWRFQRMVVDLMEITRDRQVDADESEIVDLAELGVQRDRRPGHHHARPDDARHRDVQPPTPLVHGDRRRLDRVVANLVDNAERYGGGPVRIAVLRRDGNARIEVDDAGPGVPGQFREQVFERFSRGSLAGRRGTDGGSGLGLAIVAQHVERHGGRVWVDDRPGGGARFVVEVPEVPR